MAEGVEILPGFRDFVGRLADDDHRVGTVDGGNPHGASDELRTDQGHKPARRLGLTALRHRRHHGELTNRVHEIDAYVAEMLELQRKLLFKLIDLPLRCEILDGGVDEALGNLERCLDFDARGRTGIEDRDRHRHEQSEKVNQPYRDEKLGADRPVIPESLQHVLLVSGEMSGRPGPIAHLVGASVAAHC